MGEPPPPPGAGKKSVQLYAALLAERFFGRRAEALFREPRFDDFFFAVERFDGGSQRHARYDLEMSDSPTSSGATRAAPLTSPSSRRRAGPSAS